jgi:hypothetical protein
MGVAEGSIMPAIITAHISQRRSTWRTSHRRVIIHALAPVIGRHIVRHDDDPHLRKRPGIGSTER